MRHGKESERLHPRVVSKERVQAHGGDRRNDSESRSGILRQKVLAELGVEGAINPHLYVLF